MIPPGCIGDAAISIDNHMSWGVRQEHLKGIQDLEVILGLVVARLQEQAEAKCVRRSGRENKLREVARPV
jgi:hypothetical protein